MMSKTFLTGGCLAVLVFVASPAATAQHDHAAMGHAGHADSPVNQMCPIGQEPIDPEAGTVQYKGKSIGVCCPSCADKFLAWDEAAKDKFVLLAAAHKEPGQPGAGEGDADDGVGAPYLLTTCPVSGEALGSMGDPIVKQYDGREVRFCCSGCIDKFEADKEGYFAKIDERVMHDQMRYYPTKQCVVTDEPLFEDGEDIAKNYLYEGRLVRFCCGMCKRDFKKNPAGYIQALDSAVIEAQRDAYPLATCVVSGEPLDSMGGPKEIVVAGRLVKLCCARCEDKVRAEPSTYLKMIDDAWQAKGMYLADADGDGHDHDGDDDHGGHEHAGHDHDGHGHAQGG